MNKVSVMTLGLGLLLSSTCFAYCPSGTQGNGTFRDAVSLAKHIIGETLNSGSTSLQRGVPRSKAYKITFKNVNQVLSVTLAQGGVVQHANLSAEACGGGGQIILQGLGFSVPITKSNGVLTVTLPGEQPLTFNSLSGGTEMASTNENGNEN